MITPLFVDFPRMFPSNWLDDPTRARLVTLPEPGNLYAVLMPDN